MIDHVIRLADVTKVFCRSGNPTQAEIWAIEQLQAIAEDGKLNLDFIIAERGRIAAVFQSGDYLEYEIDQQYGNLLKVDQKDPSLMESINLIRTGKQQAS